MIMEKKYLIPILEIISFNSEDIILTSGDEDDDDIGDIDDNDVE